MEKLFLIENDFKLIVMPIDVEEEEFTKEQDIRHLEKDEMEFYF